MFWPPKKSLVLAGILIAGIAFSGAVMAAPEITRIEGGSPAHAQVGVPVLMFANGLSSPVRVFFSNGTDPLIEATDVAVDLGREMIIAIVPSGAVTGHIDRTH